MRMRNARTPFVLEFHPPLKYLSLSLFFSPLPLFSRYPQAVGLETPHNSCK